FTSGYYYIKALTLEKYGYIYLFGGYDGTATNKIHIFDPINENLYITTKASLGIFGYSLTATYVPNCCVYIVGYTNDIQKSNLITDSPTFNPTSSPTTDDPTLSPTFNPTNTPTLSPTFNPTNAPTT